MRLGPQLMGRSNFTAATLQRQAGQLCSRYLALFALLLAPVPAQTARSHGILSSLQQSLREPTEATGIRSTLFVEPGASNSSLKQTANITVPVCSSAYAIITDSNAEGRWPVQHQQIAAAIHGVAAAGNQDTVITITSILQNEALYGLHRLDRCPDAQINGQNSFSLRVEHGATNSAVQPIRSGRTYYVRFTARNDAGFCNGVVPMCIPNGSDCLMHDNDALYDSLSCSLFPFLRAGSLDWSDWETEQR